MEETLTPEEVLTIEKEILTFISETEEEILPAWRRRRRWARAHAARRFRRRTGISYKRMIQRDIMPKTDLSSDTAPFAAEKWERSVTASANSWALWIDKELEEDKSALFDGIVLHDLTDQKFTFVRFWLGTSAVKAIYSLTKAYKSREPIIRFRTPIKYDPKEHIRIEVYTTMANPTIDLELTGVITEPVGKTIGKPAGE